MANTKRLSIPGRLLLLLLCFVIFLITSNFSVGMILVENDIYPPNSRIPVILDMLDPFWAIIWVLSLHAMFAAGNIGSIVGITLIIKSFFTPHKND